MAETPLHHLTATAALARLRSGTLTVESYAQALLDHIAKRQDVVKAWVYLDPELVLKQARALDKVPADQRGPLHGLPIGIKDVIYTKDMPTEHNSAIYKDSAPEIDSASVTLLRHAGALVFGKTATTEFAATTIGPLTRNPHSPSEARTPGGSSSGSAAAVADFQIPIALGTQTGGSIIRPASFNGIYGLKPTWGAISREGQKIHSLLLDTLGWFARDAEDLKLLGEVLDLKDDEQPGLFSLKGSRFALVKTHVWPLAGPGTTSAISAAASILRKHGATVDEIDLPPQFASLKEWHRVIIHTEGRASFLPETRVGADKLHDTLAVYVNKPEYSRREQLAAQDGIAALRPQFDEIAGAYDAVLTPSVPDEAPEGLEYTGDAAFCSMWTALQVPAINMPGFKGETGMPVGVTLVAPRYRDQHLLNVTEVVGKAFEAEGGWKSNLS